MGLIAVLERLDAESRAAFEKSRELAAAGLAAAPDDIAGMRAAYARERAWWNQGGPRPASSQDLEIDAGGHAVGLRIYLPETEPPHPVLLFLHGGGWVVGSIETHDRIARHLCVGSGHAVVSVDYRLAPECKFPGALDDCIAALEALPRLAAEFDLDTARIAAGGDSAGANLSLALLLYMRERGLQPTAGLLYYGAYGLTDSPSYRLYGGPEDGLGEDDMRFYREAYLASPQDQHDPRYDLLRADLRGLPPLYLLAALLDPLADDSRALALALEALDQPCRLEVYDGVLHGFLHYGRLSAKARHALDEGAEFLRRHAGG